MEKWQQDALFACLLANLRYLEIEHNQQQLYAPESVKAKEKIRQKFKIGVTFINLLR